MTRGDVLGYYLKDVNLYLLKIKYNMDDENDFFRNI